MIKVLQIGEGNFLRTFVDAYFDTLNKEDKGDFEVHIMKPIPFGNLDNFKKQNFKYHINLRGFINNNSVSDYYHIDCVKDVFSPFDEYDKFLSLANDPFLKVIVSNTTEAGIAFNGEDKIDDFINITYPAKLTKLLLERFNAGLEGLYILPVELIENNADELSKCVFKYIETWKLPLDFSKWVNNNVFFCNTLVDRVVSGFPKDETLRKKMFEEIKQEDNLISIGEPFGLWAIENKGDIKNILFEGHHNIDVILTDNIAYYKKRKVRILNGSHTNLVPLCLWLGKENVYDCMIDPNTKKFIYDSLEEIIPFVSSNINETKSYADSVMERFLNPFINHQLTSISLNSISKWKARDLPSFIDYYSLNKVIPSNLTIGFTYLANQYMHIYQKDNSYFVDLPSRTIEVRDDKNCIEYFINGHSLKDFMSDISLWGIDLTKFNGFYDTVLDGLNKIKNGENLI